MTQFDYTQNIPNEPNNPSADVQPMKVNTNSTAGIIAVDHIGFGVPDGGYHTVIHQKPFNNVTWNPAAPSGTPAPIAGVQQTFAMNYLPDTAGATLDTQLFTLTGNNSLSQLCGHNAASEGYVWCSGILLQWGTVNFPPTSGTVTFKNRAAGCIPFPNNCYIVQATLTGTSSTTNTVSIISISKTSFTWNFTGTTSYTGFYWFAVGN